MDRIERATLAAIGGLLVWQLFLPPVTGLTNGGDFCKVIGVFDLRAPGTEYHWASTVYRFHPRFHWWARFYSSEILLAGVAVGLNWLFSKTPTFDLRFMGAVHGGLWFLAMFLLLPLLRGLPARKRVVIGVLLAVIGCDALYALTFNTFYPDAGAGVFLLLTLVLFLRTLRWLRPLEFAAFVLCAALFLTAKAQHAILGLPIAALAGYSLTRAGKRAWAGIAAATALAAGGFSLWGVPAFYRVSGVYSTIFWSLLPSSKDVPGDLAALGLDDSYRRYIGTHSYTPGGVMNDPEFVRAFPRRTSYARLGWFYATHPGRAYRVLTTALDDGGRQRPTGGNFEPGSGMPPDSESHSFQLWSGLKRWAFHNRGLAYLVSALALSTAFLCCARRAGATTLGLGFVCIVLLDLGVSTLGDVLDPIRHLLLFSSMLDIMVVAVVVLLSADYRGTSLSTAALWTASIARC